MFLLTSYLLSISLIAEAKYQISQVHTSLCDSESSVLVQWAVDEFTDQVSLNYFNKHSSPESPTEPLVWLASDVTCKIFYNEYRNSASRTLFTCLASLVDLDLNSYYLYRIGSDSLGWSDIYTLRTKRNAEDAKFIVYGDLGIGIQANDTLTSVTNVFKEGNYDGVLHVGDMAYNLDSSNGSVGDLFLKSIEPFASTFPYMVSQGNHERFGSEHHYYNRFTMPGATDNLWYSFNYGRAHFLAYTQEPLFYGPLSLLDPQLQFIKDDLSTLDRIKYPWLIVYTHRPFYCSERVMENNNLFHSEAHVQGTATHVNNMEDCTTAADLIRENFEDLWYENKVDLIVSGHMHAYERLNPVYKSVGQGCNVTTQNSCQGAKAPVFIVSGIPGNQESYAYGSDQLLSFSAFQTSHVSFGKLQIIDEDHLLWEQIASDTGEVIDYFDLYK